MRIERFLKGQAVYLKGHEQESAGIPGTTSEELTSVGENNKLLIDSIICRSDKECSQNYKF